VVMDDGGAFSILLDINGEGGGGAALCEDLHW
jgi:hypothetical protein